MHQNNNGFLDTRANRLVTYNHAEGLCLGVRATEIPILRNGDRDLLHASQFKPIITYMKLA